MYMGNSAPRKWMFPWLQMEKPREPTGSHQNGSEKLPKTSKREPTGGKREPKRARGTSQKTTWWKGFNNWWKKVLNPIHLRTITDQSLVKIRINKSSNEIAPKHGTWCQRGAPMESKSMAKLTKSNAKPGNEQKTWKSSKSMCFWSVKTCKSIINTVLRAPRCVRKVKRY